MTTLTRANSSTLGAVIALTAMLLLVTTPAVAQSPAVDATRFYGSAEYLLWWTKDSPAAPPLLSTGRLGDPDFSVVFGGRDYDTGLRQGGRFSAGYQITPDWGIQGIGFFLPTASVTRTVSSSGAPGSVRLVIPVFRVEQGQEGRLTIANPGEFLGDARESLRSGLHGAELNVTRRIAGPGDWRLDALGGFRYLRLAETLSFSAASVFIDAPDVFSPTDVFATTNRFYGLQAGVKGEYVYRGWFAQGTAKIALGVMRESLDISGTLLTDNFNNFVSPLLYPGGVFAQATNIGQHDRDRFAVVPEVGLKLGYRLTSWASVFVGYTFLYASAVLRPGPQIDRNVNTTQALAFQIPQTPPPPVTLMGPAQPAVRFRESSFWAQGLDLGVAFRF